MYLSFVVLFEALAIAALMAARRDRLFLLAAMAGAIGLTDGIVWGVDRSLGSPSLGMVALLAALAITAAEAAGLPGPLARLTRLGVHNPERDYDWRLWKLVAPFSATLEDRAVAERTPRRGSREQLMRDGRRLIEQLAATVPPTDEWRSVRDGYAGAIRGELAQLVDAASEPDQLRAFRAAMSETVALLGRLRDAYRPTAPASPRWAALVALLVLLVVEGNALDLYDRALDHVAPPVVAAGWRSMPVPFARGDGWPGDALTDGGRLYLATRENVDGFWGAMKIRSSSDGGLTWSAPAAASYTDLPDTARQTITLGPDGSLWVAFVRQGQQPATQYLQIGHSVDDGRTWPSLMRASPPSVGLIGLPALLMTPEVHLVAYTDGATGAILVQPLTTSGQVVAPAIWRPTSLGTTSRQLYSDANFLDAGIALAAIHRHVVALWHPSDGVLAVSVSADGGLTWRRAPPLATNAARDAPQLLVVQGRLAALDVRTGTSIGARSWLQLDTSRDGGQSWSTGSPLSNGLFASQGVLAVSAAGWQLVYPACPGAIVCTTFPRIWYRTSSDGERWSDPQALSQPGTFMGVLGVGTTAGRRWALWVQDPDGSAEHRAVRGMLAP